MAVFNPRTYQEEGIKQILMNDRTMLAVLMGGGKTALCLSAALALQDMEMRRIRTLVLAPLAVAKTTWPDEVKKWDNFKHITIAVAHGSKDERIAALESDADIVTINYDAADFLADYYVGKDFPFQMIVFDESTKLKNFRLGAGGTKRAKALATLAWRPEVMRVVALTGTLCPNGFKDLWGQYWFLDYGQRLGRSYTVFKNKWFWEINSRRGYPGKLMLMPGAAEEIRKNIADITLSIDPKDYFPVDDPIRQIWDVEIPASARELYDKMEQELAVELEKSGGDVTAANVAVAMNKCLQISNGALYLEDHNWEEMHDAKLDKLGEILDGLNGAPLLVAYQFKSDMQRILKKFPHAEVLTSANVSEVVPKWNKGEIELLLAHPKAAGHGLNLAEGGQHLCYFGVDWNLELHLQIQERIGPTRQAQLGLQRNAFFHYIISKDSIDGVVLDRLQGKQDLQSGLMSRLKKA